MNKMVKENFMSSLGELGYSALTWGIIIIVGVIIFGILGFVGWWFYTRKKWNLRTEIKMPRSDGKIVMSEKAKGHYDIASGIVDIKRKGLKSAGMKPFDVRKCLQGNNFLEVIQIGANDYLPILSKSYLKVKDEDGKEYAILEIEANLEKRKTWKTYMERSGKDRFTLAGWLDKHWRALELGIIMFVIFLGFSILWMRLPSVCG